LTLKLFAALTTILTGTDFSLVSTAPKPLKFCPRQCSAEPQLVISIAWWFNSINLYMPDSLLSFMSFAPLSICPFSLHLCHQSLAPIAGRRFHVDQ
jgi:hypothetical protein